MRTFIERIEWSGRLKQNFLHLFASLWAEQPIIGVTKYFYYIKADMNIYISLESAAIFFLENLFLQQGISSEYVMVDFICMVLLDLCGARTENYKMKNYCPQWDSNPGYSA